MKRDGGVVLINALVIVLAISAVAAALLTRSEAARVRLGHAQGAHQLELYLDGVERFVPDILDEVSNGAPVHPGQDWTTSGRSYPIDRGRVGLEIVDLQGRLNVNWLMKEDEYAFQVFSRVFADVGAPQSLLLEIKEFVGPSGPRSVSDYQTRKPPVLPRGGPLRVLDDLREVQGMTPGYFALLEPVLSALPVDARLNLNTASDAVMKAAIEPLPTAVVTEILNRDAPIQGMAEIRRRVTEILESEDLDHLPLRRLTVSSTQFRADLTAELDGLVQRRQVVFLIDSASETPVTAAYRWAVYD